MISRQLIRSILFGVEVEDDKVPDTQSDRTHSDTFHHYHAELFPHTARPGGPFDAEKRIPVQILRNIEKKFHLDEPLIVQYGRYLFDIIRGDLGPSFKYQSHDVNFYIFQSLPNSMFLGVISLSIAVILGITAGVVSAIKQILG
jgi:ABC-type microcin C transport system permease subunit YejB